ncbi:sulfatase-like hydrolase/transferase [Pseudocolwellia agarivorans]|uniref:sulfatase-like hydrolase/transferase n=1 Tax=Pseudocolwellia agarivorans TaxID=1911682 RepID=UPI000985DA39|nr:sulfatase-like hydrolase/transferase [Pseudocolwellia agarivorans]
MIINNSFKSLSMIAALLCSSCAIASKAPERPNILFILADDLGYADVGFNGSPDIKTPNLDKLASNGTVFTSAYTAHPFCGPSRAGLLTGRYPHKFGSQFNLPESDSSGGLGVPVEETYISDVLHNSGYFTGAIGKWHLGEMAEHHPNVRGFDEFYGFLNGGHQYFPEEFKASVKQWKAQGLEHAIPGYFRPLEHNGQDVDEKEYITDGLSREAVTFIEKAAKKKDQPFFLYLAYNAPHSPMQAKEEDMAMFPEIKDKKRKTYAGMVYAVDRGVKKIVESLKATGQFENTLIVFTSDNGGKLKFGANNYPLTAGKGSVHEGGYRAPMFFHWPNQVPANKKYTYPVSALDFFPTFAGLANAEIPTSKQLDGKNIWSKFLANESARKGETIFAMRHRLGYSDVSARKDNWKVIRTANGKWQLFDVDKDMAEKHDLSAKHPNIVRELVTSLSTWSWTHADPKWFHIHKEGYEWREKSMPRFHETFSLDK